MDEKLPVRKNIRLPGYNYSDAGYYFVTICVKDNRETLGKITVGDGLARPILPVPPLTRPAAASQYFRKKTAFIPGVARWAVRAAEQEQRVGIAIRISLGHMQVVF